MLRRHTVIEILACQALLVLPFIVLSPAAAQQSIDTEGICLLSHSFKHWRKTKTAVAARTSIAIQSEAHRTRRQQGLPSESSGSTDIALASSSDISTSVTESEALDGLLKLAADSARDNVTYRFLQKLQLCASCKSFMRYGPERDGGSYIMCEDDLAAPGLLSAYSFGIRGFDNWGAQVASRFNLSVFEFDCFNASVPYPGSSQIHFFGECLIGSQEKRPNGKFRSLSEVVSQHNPHAGDGSLLAKIDVEGAEWVALLQEPITTLRKFRQIVIELHDIGNTTRHALYDQMMAHMFDAGFRTVHLHGNNFGPMTYFGKYSVPNFLEVTFVPWSSKDCPKMKYRIPEDLPTNPNLKDLPDAHLPHSSSPSPSPSP